MKPTTFDYDLSADETKISFELLIKTAEIAVGYAKTECERAMSNVQNMSFKGDYTAMRYAAHNLSVYADALKTATNTLHALNESKTRSKFTIIGKPPVKEFLK